MPTPEMDGQPTFRFRVNYLDKRYRCGRQHVPDIQFDRGIVLQRPFLYQRNQRDIADRDTSCFKSHMIVVNGGGHKNESL